MLEARLYWQAATRLREAAVADDKTCDIVDDIDTLGAVTDWPALKARCEQMVAVYKERRRCVLLA